MGHFIVPGTATLQGSDVTASTAGCSVVRCKLNKKILAQSPVG